MISAETNCAGRGDSAAVVYALTERTPSGRNLSRYIGVTSGAVETRVKWHAWQVNRTRERNAALAGLLSSGAPSFKVIAVVPDDERFGHETEITRRYRRHHRVFNILDGQRHTPESIRRIKAGMARSRASRAGSDP